MAHSRVELNARPLFLTRKSHQIKIPRDEPTSDKSAAKYINRPGMRLFTNIDTPVLTSINRESVQRRVATDKNKRGNY